MNEVKPLQMAQIQGQTYFQHVDGGWYVFIMSAAHCDTGEELVVYQHIWPFEERTQMKPVADFLKRFTQKTAREYIQATSLNALRTVTQQLIQAQKNERKAKELKNTIELSDPRSGTL